MSNTMNMQADNLGKFVEREYEQTGPFQWVREVVANSHQAGATEVVFTTEPVALEAIGVHRRVVWDDGHGMTADEMPRFLNRFGGSGRVVGVTTDNYGIGAKIALLPWNQHGLVVISRKDGETSMCWLHQDQDTGEYGVRLFEDEVAPTGWVQVVDLDAYIDFPVDGVDWVQVAAPLGEHGTMLVLLGETANTDTFLGDPNRPAEGTKYGLPRYLNGRLWQTGMAISVNQYGQHATPSQWPTVAGSFENTDGKGQVRGVGGLESVLRRHATPTKDHPGRGIVASGTWSMGRTAENPLAVEIDWTLFTEESAKRVGSETGHHNSARIGLPIIGVRHESHTGFPEVYELKGSAEGGTTAQAKAAMKQFVRLENVRDRLALVVRPQPEPGQTVGPNPSRSRLLLSDPAGSQPMPWDAWAEGWGRSMPDEVRQAIAAWYAANQSTSQVDPEVRKRLASKYLSHLKDRFKVLTTRGTGTTGRSGATGTGGSGGTRKHQTQGGNRKATRPQGAGTSGASQRTVSGGLVTVTIAPIPGATWAVSYDGQMDVATVNTESAAYRRVQEFIVDKYRGTGHIRQDHDEVEVVEAMNAAIAEHVTLAVTEAITDARDNPTQREEEGPLSEAALSNVLRGIKHIEVMAAGAVGRRLGRAA